MTVYKITERRNVVKQSAVFVFFVIVIGQVCENVIKNKASRRDALD